MRILSQTGGIAATNCYLVVDDDSKSCVLFDAPDHTVEPILDFVYSENLNLVGLWLTHGHFDHLADHALVTERFPQAEVLIHQRDEHKLLKPGSSIFKLPFDIPPGKPTRFIEDGETLKLGKIAFEVMHTPGHSPGHVAFHAKEQGVLIGGDLIIGGAIGRTDLPDSSYDQLAESIRRVMKLPDTTQLLPGHGPPGSLADERKGNPYVRRILSGK